MDFSVGQLELALLRARLHTFERRFYNLAGSRYVELHQARAEAVRLRARFMPAVDRDARLAKQTAAASAEECGTALQRPAADPEKFRQLHRDLARHFHPDLASDGARRVVREKLMTEVNLAFQEEDLRHLELLAGALEPHEQAAAARLLAELSNSPVNELRERADYAQRQGRDLIAELARHIERGTDDIRQQGARGIPISGPQITLVERALAEVGAFVSGRPVTFPADRSMGKLYLRAERDIDAPLKLAGEAQGTLEIPFGQSAILRLNSGSSDLSPLRELDKYALHGLIDEWPDFVRLDDDQLQSLGHFPGLEVIQLGRTDVTGRVFEHFRSLHELRVLILDETQFDDAGLLRLEPCVWMQRLDLSLTKVTGSGLQAIRNMTAMRDLNLHGTKVSDADLEVLARLPGLRDLNLGLTKITDAAASRLAHLKSLEVLNLGGTALTDAILETLATLPALRELVLWETAISARGLTRLKSFPALRYLDVDETKVPAEALLAFREARPEIRLPSDIWSPAP